ncbi:hydroxyethylthiazole kinase, partial [Escherichia coli]|uniref:hydroxyethylthiazole kinase n=1 Tax=Escherichia coli TaxID=562 RepID=UPI000B6E8900
PLQFVIYLTDPPSFISCLINWMKQAGERAVASSEGPGSFVPHFLDALWQLTPEVQA